MIQHRVRKRKGICIAVGLLMLSLLLLSAAGCSSVSSAQESFEEMMQAFQTGDREQISAYYDFAKISKFINAKDSEDMESAVLATLPSMEYKVNSAEKSGKQTMKLNVEITTVDFSVVMQNYIQKVMELVGSPEYQENISGMTKEEYQALLAQQLTDVLRQGELPKATNTLDVTMMKSDKEWKLGGDGEAFLGALFANLSNAVNALI